MVKKVKLDELADEETALEAPQTREPEEHTQVLPKLSVDALSEDPYQIPTPGPKVEPQELKKEERPKKIPTQFFDRSFLATYLWKLTSFLVVLIIFEAVVHFMRYFDDVNVLNFSNYRPYLYDQRLDWNIVKAIAFATVVFLITPRDSIRVNALGVFCIKNAMSKSIFMVSHTIHVPWQKIRVVKFEVRFFEPYLVFYENEHGPLLGMINFSLKDEAAFFSYVKTHAGDKHPLYLVKNHLKSF